MRRRLNKIARRNARNAARIDTTPVVDHLELGWFDYNLTLDEYRAIFRKEEYRQDEDYIYDEPYEDYCPYEYLD